MIERVGSDAIRLERVLDAPPEKFGATSPKPSFGEQWFMGGTDARAGGEFDLLVDHDNLSDDKDVPYPDGYAHSKARSGTKRSLASSRRGCSRPRSRAARTARSLTSCFPKAAGPGSS